MGYQVTFPPRRVGGATIRRKQARCTEMNREVVAVRRRGIGHMFVNTEYGNGVK